MFIGNNAIKWHFVFCHCISVSLNKFCIQPFFLCTLKAKKYFQTININDSVSWVKYAVWSDRSTYCYLEIYELWAFISGRQFLATKTKVKGFNHCNFSFPSRSRSFPRMEASDSLPEFREWIFSFPSRSRISGMDFFHSLPVPEFREWIFSIPFPFPNWPFQSRESKGKMGDFKRC